MSTAFVISPLPKICTSRGPRSVVRHGSETNLRKRARAHCTKIRRVMLCHITNPGEDSGDSDDTPTVPGDWREFRAALVAGSAEKLERSKETAYRKGHWAHSLSVPEMGCFLASHPAYYRRAVPYLTQSVVFVTSYDPNEGAAGLVLNRPLRGTAAELEAAGMFGRSTNISATSLAGQPIYAGGPDILETGVLTVLHGEERLAETTEMRQPLEGVFVGDAIKFLERETDADISKIRVFTGCIRWGPGKLEKEVDDGLWYCVSASNLYALKHCIQLPKPLWVEIMQSQGQPFSQIASQVYKDESESEDEL